MNETIVTRLEALRAKMRAEGVDAVYIPTSDYHNSEYVGDYFQLRAYFSGFTGSAGTLVVLKDEAGLWTDGRYFLQAEEQLAGTGVDLYKSGEKGVPAPEAFLAGKLAEGNVLALDGRTVGEAEYAKIEGALEGVLIRTDFDPAENVWADRPAPAASPVSAFPVEYSGRSAAEKLDDLRKEMERKGATAHVITSLDDIAWLFNLRGSDVEYNPVFLSFAVVERTAAVLFTDGTRLEADAAGSLAEAGVTVAPYDEFYRYLEKFTLEDSVLVSETQASHRVFAVLEGKTNVIRCHFTPVTVAKQLRNDTERVNVCVAHRRDGAAVVKLLYRLDKEYKSGSVREGDRRLRTELDVSRALAGYRAEQPNAKGPSFETIAGYGPHGAIIHYEPTPETDAPLDANGFLLLDSGGQYLEGTTDITRTIALGPLTDEQKTDFTLVLKGTIDLAMAKFPEGTCGYTLDILARKALWDAGLDYNHGTGHGVGHFLCVHEGPAGIRRVPGDRVDQIPLKPGMVISDEPGIYRAGSHGVRIENLVMVVRAEEEGFLQFETLTCVPIDRSAIRKELLSPAEIDWLDGYHAWVRRVLTPLLDMPEAVWLEQATQPL